MSRYRNCSSIELLALLLFKAHASYLKLFMIWNAQSPHELCFKLNSTIYLNFSWKFILCDTNWISNFYTQVSCNIYDATCTKIWYCYHQVWSLWLITRGIVTITWQGRDVKCALRSRVLSLSCRQAYRPHEYMCYCSLSTVAVPKLGGGGTSFRQILTATTWFVRLHTGLVDSYSRRHRVFT